jgi:hypothetical protein
MKPVTQSELKHIRQCEELYEIDYSTYYRWTGRGFK